MPIAHPSKVQEFLNSFEDVEEIISHCKEKDIRGVMNDAEFCPLAEVLKEKFGNFNFVVGPDAIAWQAKKGMDRSAPFQFMLDLPDMPVAYSFRYGFDIGQIPVLIKV